MLKKYALLWVYLGCCAILMFALLAYSWFHVPTPPEPGILLPCATEDSDNCWWDATEGNGEGLSFVVIDGKVTYLAPKGR